MIRSFEHAALDRRARSHQVPASLAPVWSAPSAKRRFYRWGDHLIATDPDGVSVATRQAPATWVSTALPLLGIAPGGDGPLVATRDGRVLRWIPPGEWRELWRAPDPARFAGARDLGEGRLVVFEAAEKHALTPVAIGADGAELWRSAETLLDVEAIDGRVVVRARGETAYRRIDPTTGRTLWTWDPDDAATPVAAIGDALWAVYEGTLGAIDLETGAVRVSIERPGFLDGPVDAQGVLHALHGGWYRRFDLADGGRELGAHRLRVTAGGPSSPASPIPCDDGRIVFKDADAVWHLRPESREAPELVWRHRHDLIQVFAADRGLLALDTADQLIGLE